MTPRYDLSPVAVARLLGISRKVADSLMLRGATGDVTGIPSKNLAAPGHKRMLRTSLAALKQWSLITTAEPIETIVPIRVMTHRETHDYVKRLAAEARRLPH